MYRKRQMDQKMSCQKGYVIKVTKMLHTVGAKSARYCFRVCFLYINTRFLGKIEVCRR